VSNIFELQGTPVQNAIVEDALRRCSFPFELLAPKLKADTGRNQIPVEWADLSRYAAQIATAKESGGHAHIHEGDDTGHPIEARERVLGLAWYSGKVSIEQALVSQPELAKEVFLSEGAHMVDFFLMSDEQRRLIFNALHGSEADVADHGNDWFDKGPYSSWAGEAFMGLFVKAFSDVQMTMPFEHPVTDYTIERAREVLLPAPDVPTSPVYGSKRGRTYHDEHKGIARDIEWESAAEAEAAGRRACRVCRPA
jgi:hypothetical protein